MIGIQIYLRASIKTEFMFTEFLTPVELMNYFSISAEIEEQKQDASIQAKRDKGNKR